MSDVKAVWRAMGKLSRAQSAMEHYVHGPQGDQDWANMRVVVIKEIDACLSELRSGLMDRVRGGDE